MPSPRDVLVRALSEAGVGPDSFVIDLGSGDGRVPMLAAKEFGARAVGVEIDGALVEHAERTRKASGLKGVRFVRADARRVDLGSVDFVFTYLTTDALEAIKPALLTADEEAVVIAHDYPVKGWTPAEVLRLWSSSTGRHHVFYLYRVGEVLRAQVPSGSSSGAVMGSVRPGLRIRSLLENT